VILFYTKQLKKGRKEERREGGNKRGMKGKKGREE